MFDFHLHSSVSVDSDCPPEEHLRRAEALGLREICFTDHYDFNDDLTKKQNFFDIRDYRRALDSLHSEKVIIRRGVEFGLTPWNRPHMSALLSS